MEIKVSQKEGCIIADVELTPYIGRLLTSPPIKEHMSATIMWRHLRDIGYKPGELRSGSSIWNYANGQTLNGSYIYEDLQTEDANVNKTSKSKSKSKTAKTTVTKTEMEKDYLQAAYSENKKSTKK